MKNGRNFTKKWMKNIKKEKFETLKIKTSVAKKFRRVSRDLSKSHSMTLLSMVVFFEMNSISPHEMMGPKMQTLENLVKKKNKCSYRNFERYREE